MSEPQNVKRRIKASSSTTTTSLSSSNARVGIIINNSNNKNNGSYTKVSRASRGVILCIGFGLMLQTLVAVYFFSSRNYYGEPANTNSSSSYSQQQQQQFRQTKEEYQKQGEDDESPSPFLPILKPLPLYLTPLMEDAEHRTQKQELVQGTLGGTNPTITGIIIVLQQFFIEFHTFHQQVGEEIRLAMEKNRKEAHGNNQERARKRMETKNYYRSMIFHKYFDLIQTHIMPFEDTYQGKSIFPIRKDDSIFISIVAYRDHQLGKTLLDIYNKAKYPHNIYVGIVIQNCFGIDKPCKTGIQLTGEKDKHGNEKTQRSDTSPDANGIEEFCNYIPTTNTTTENHPKTYQELYCDTGHVRALYVNESEAIGPAAARYFASKLWGGETYYVQIDSHLVFAEHFDVRYIQELKATKHYPQSVLSSYPPGFKQLFRLGNSSGTRLCACQFGEYDMVRISTAKNYPKEGFLDGPIKQIAYIAAGFFFTPSEFLRHVPYDPFLPYTFMGEELALSIRAYTHGYKMYAPRVNLIAHEYRPGSLGLPKFWETIYDTYQYLLSHDDFQELFIKRIKYLTGYPNVTFSTPANENSIKNEKELLLFKLEDSYGLGQIHTGDEYINFAGIDFINKKCNRIAWCADQKLE